MKWFILVIATVLLSSCGYTTTEVVEYRQVAVTPVIEPVYFSPDGQIDVTTTTIDYY